MASLQLRPTWVFEVTQEDMLIILKALGGRLKPEEIDRAEELGNDLTKQRAAALERTAQQLRVAVEIDSGAWASARDALER